MTELILFIGVILIALAAIALAAVVMITGRQERQELLRQLTAKDQDILDRLMAKSLPEVKQAQREPETGVVTSKRRNEERLTKENAR